MKQTFSIILLFILIPASSLAKSFYVHDADSSHAYILRQPSPGIFLGEMMRRIDLKPDWQNRQWIRIIHQANPGVVDAQGEILYHDNEIKIPLAAMKTLKGYSRLENYFTAVPPGGTDDEQPEDDEPVPNSDPVAELPPVAPSAPVTAPDSATEDVPRVELISNGSQDVRHGFRADLLVGGGSERLEMDNSIGNTATLISEANFFGSLNFTKNIMENHQLLLSTLIQYKTYTPPPSVNVVEDSTFLMQFEYGYSYRLFNNFFFGLLGRSQQQNFIRFQGSAIALDTVWNHSAGLTMEAPLFYMGSRQLSFDLSGLYSYTTDAEFDIDGGFLASAGLNLVPKNLNSGWLISLRGNYQNQKPTGYFSHTSIEGLAAIGYGF